MPRRAACQAASEPASPPPITINVSDMVYYTLSLMTENANNDPGREKKGYPEDYPEDRHQT
jgi:hypothetical protein